MVKRDFKPYWSEMNIRQLKRPSEARNKVQAYFYAQRIAMCQLWIALSLCATTPKRIKTHEQARELRDRLRYNADTEEILTFDAAYESYVTNNALHSCLLRAIESLTDKIHMRMWQKLSEAKSDPCVIAEAERYVLQNRVPESEKLVVFESGDVSMSYALTLLCSQEASRGYAEIGEFNSLSCARRSVYEALCRAQNDPFNGVEKHRRASEAVEVLYGLERELFLKLYRENGMNLREAHAAAVALTAQV